MFFEANASTPRGVIMLGNRYVYDWVSWWAEGDIERALYETA